MRVARGPVLKPQAASTDSSRDAPCPEVAARDDGRHMQRRRHLGTFAWIGSFLLVVAAVLAGGYGRVDRPDGAGPVGRATTVPLAPSQVRTPRAWHLIDRSSDGSVTWSLDGTLANVAAAEFVGRPPADPDELRASAEVFAREAEHTRPGYERSLVRRAGNVGDSPAVSHTFSALLEGTRVEHDQRIVLDRGRGRIWLVTFTLLPGADAVRRSSDQQLFLQRVLGVGGAASANSRLTPRRASPRPAPRAGPPAAVRPPRPAPPCAGAGRSAWPRAGTGDRARTPATFP